MSFFEDQEDEWYANNCEGNIEDYGFGDQYPEEENTDDHESD